MQTMGAANSAVEYRFNTAVHEHTCPLCGREFQARIGTWPYLADTGAPVCGQEGCPIGDDIVHAAPCDTLFRFAPLAPETLRALQAAGETGTAVAEQLRTVSLDDSLPSGDRNLLQLAAIDLQYCQADDTRIEALDDTLVLRTCGEAAAELLLSGCGDIV